ncbi:uncharacterized protein [Mytilus edulis]|uniref:uncharacterized protein isoform X1 n=1 Tax=Mytilus edulis TaxID=6550 RepID=UPI0039EE392C
MQSCAAVTGLILLVITDLGTIISYATPFWVVHSTNRDQGLWALCEGTNCQWIYDASFLTGKEFHKEGWFIAVQGLMSVGLALCLLSLLIATISLCCQKQSCSPSGTIAGLLLTTFLAMCVAVILFGIKASQELKVTVGFDSKTDDCFGWSFWLAAASAALSLATSGVYGCASRID